jgi:cystathionine beta-lyase/cystathionine gamma-synthase
VISVRMLDDRIAVVETHVNDAVECIAHLESLASANQTAALDLSRLEDSMQSVRSEVSELSNLVGREFTSFQHSLESNAASIEAARTAVAQTDDLVERVVEALESVQSAVLDSSGQSALLSSELHQ